MLPLTVDDLLPLEEYAARRKEFFDAHRRYVDRYRRIRIGPKLTLIFENRQTLWFRVQELLRLARLDDPEQIQRELDWYNRLLPTAERLQASLLIHIPPDADRRNALQFWHGLPGNAIQLNLDSLCVPGRLLTSSDTPGTAHWIEFDLNDAAKEALADFQSEAFFEVDYQSYHVARVLLGEKMRESLLEDVLSMPLVKAA